MRINQSLESFDRHQSRTQSMPVRRLGAGHDSGETELNSWREINDTDTGKCGNYTWKFPNTT